MAKLFFKNKIDKIINANLSNNFRTVNIYTNPVTHLSVIETDVLT